MNQPINQGRYGWNLPLQSIGWVLAALAVFMHNDKNKATSQFSQGSLPAASKHHTQSLTLGLCTAAGERGRGKDGGALYLFKAGFPKPGKYNTTNYDRCMLVSTPQNAMKPNAILDVWLAVFHENQWHINSFRMEDMFLQQNMKLTCFSSSYAFSFHT